MYSETLLALSKDPSHRGDARARAFHTLRRNTACGDEVEVGFDLHEGRVVRLVFHPRGCAVSAASAAALCAHLDGVERREARARVERAVAFFGGQAEWSEPWGRDVLPALGSLRARPMRMACVRLAWEAMATLLEGEGFP